MHGDKESLFRNIYDKARSFLDVKCLVQFLELLVKMPPIQAVVQVTSNIIPHCSDC